MKAKPYVYLATSLTHVPVEERPQICELVTYLMEHTKFIQWAFNPKTWTPKPVKNIFEFDTTIVTELADFVAGVFWSSAGSDGRGAELYARAIKLEGRAMAIFVKEGVKITPFITHMAVKYNIKMITFVSIQELGEAIVDCAQRLHPGNDFTSSRQIDIDMYRRGHGGSCKEAISQFLSLSEG